MNNINVWYSIFTKLLNMSITASIVIVFVVIARFFLRKAPKIFSYILWSVVLFRLVCPYSFTTSVSLLNLMNPKSVGDGTVVYMEDMIDTGESQDSVSVQIAEVDIGEAINSTLSRENEQSGNESLQLLVTIVTYVWLLGILGMAGYSVISVMKLKKKLVGAVKFKENIWIADHIYTSFVMGIFRPRIYVQSGLPQGEQEFVILHERIHIKRCDHLVKLFFWAALTVHWFNPLVWLSYILCMKDMEMSCDESVMKRMKDDIRADYSQSLLSLAAGRKIVTGMLLFFGGGDIKYRIKNVLNYKKPKVWVIITGIIIVVFLCISFMGNPAERSTLSDEQNIYEGSTKSNSVYVRTMGPGSIGCEYGYCVNGEYDETEILTNLEKMNGFRFSNNYSEDVALFCSEEPQEIKLYHALAGNEGYEEYAFAGEEYEYPFGAERTKYVIRVPQNYGMHYFFAVISWEDGREDIMYFSMEYQYNPPSDTEYNSVTITKSASGTTEVKYPQLNFPSQTMKSFAVQLTLPQGWYLEKRESSASDIANLSTNEISGAFLTTYIFDENGICVGKMGCNYYELYEGAEDNPQAIYNQVALGNHYRFNVHDTYEVIKANDIIETGMADVLYDIESADAGSSTGVNYGILSRSKESLVYVVLEFEKEPVSAEEVKNVADSISFEITGSN